MGAARDGSEPPAKRGQSIQAPRNLVPVPSGAEPVELERVRHPGGVVQASDVRGDRRCENGHTPKGRCLDVDDADAALLANPELGLEHREPGRPDEHVGLGAGA